MVRLAGIAFFTAFIALGAQIEIYFGGPVPFTLQVLVVLLAGMVLGARDGAASVLAYLGLIALNLPVAAGGAGNAAFTGATAGYLIGFVPAAFVAGWLVEHGAGRIWQRWLAGMVGVGIIYLFGVPVLKLVLGVDWSTAWQYGGYPFLGLDAIKALIAAGLVETTRALLLRLDEPEKKKR
jgi:biotin transport system substrate-specific component